MRGRVATGLRLVVGLAIVVVLLRVVDPDRVRETFARLPAIAWALFAAPPLLMVLRAYLATALLLGALGERLPGGRLLRRVTTARAVGSFLPARIGEVSLVPLLARDGVPSGRTAAALLVDKMTTAALLAGIALTALPLWTTGRTGLWTALPLIGVLGAVFASPLLLRGLRRAIAGRRGRWARALREGGRSADVLLRHRPGTLVRLAALSAGALALLVGALGLLLAAAGERVPYTLLLGAHGIGMVAAQLPITVAGLGVRESVVAGLLARAGADAAVVTAVYLGVAAVSHVFYGAVLAVAALRSRGGDRDGDRDGDAGAARGGAS